MALKRRRAHFPLVQDMAAAPACVAVAFQVRSSRNPIRWRAARRARGYRVTRTRRPLAGVMALAHSLPHEAATLCARLPTTGALTILPQLDQPLAMN